MVKKTILLCLTSFSILLSTGQTPEFLKYQQKYEKENGVFLNLQEKVKITLGKNGKPEILLKHSEERLFLNENAKHYVEDDVSFSSFVNLEDLTPYVLIPNGTKYKKNKITDFKIVDDYDRAIFYDDIKKKQFYYKGLVKGGKTKLDYTKKLNEPHFFGSFFFSSYMPVEQASYEVEVPRNLKLTFKTFGDFKDKINYSKREKGSSVIHSWNVKELSKAPIEDGAVSFSHYATHIVVHISEYKYKKEDKHILRNVDDLYSYYYNFVKDLEKEEPSDEMKKLADSLTVNCKTNEEKVKSVFYWVQDNIKYVAFEDGLGGFIPRKSSLVCSRRYGDCKDKSSIIRDLLKLADVPAYLTWIGTRSLPYSYYDVPTPRSDNHMICSYFDGEEYIMLDGTGSHLPYGYPTPFIQGKEALIGIDEKTFKIVKVPEMDVTKNLNRDSIEIHIDGELVTGKGEASYKGYPAMFLNDKITNMSNEQKKKYYKRTFKKGNNKSTAEVHDVINLGEKDKDLAFTYSFKVPDYTKMNGDEIYFNPFLKKYFSGEKIDLSTNTVDKEIMYKDQFISKQIIHVPEGYKVEYLPENSSYTHDKFGFDIQFKELKEEKKIIMDIVYTNNHLVLKSEEFKDWNKMIKKLNASYSETIIFKKQ